MIDMPPPSPPVRVAPRSPAAAIFLSFLIPGAGSMYASAVGPGIAILAIYVLGWIGAVFLIGIPVLIGAWIAGMCHAYSASIRWNREHGVIS